MSINKKEVIEKELNKKCLKCQSEFKKDEIEFDPRGCTYCPIGRKVHKYDNSAWDAVDWSAFQVKDYYGQ